MAFTNPVLLVEAMLPPPISQPPHILECLVANKVVSTVELVLVEGFGQVNYAVMNYGSDSNKFIQEQQVVGYWDIYLEGRGVLITV